MLTNKHKEEIQQRGLYDFIVNNYWKLTQEEMKELFKEFAYAVYSLDKDLEQQAVDLMLEEIEFIKDDEEAE